MVLETAAPFPFPPAVTSRRGESETAVQVLAEAQLVAASVKLPVSGVPLVPGPLPRVALEGLSEKAQAPGAVCVTVNVCVAIVMLPLRPTPLLAATLYPTDPLPAPEAPAVIVIHAALLTAVQGASGGVAITFTL